MENPKIRFKGFTKDWEQRKFSDIASRESVSRESSYDLPSLEYEDVIAEEGRLNKDISLKENIKKGIVFDGSQVLYGKLRPYLHNWLNPDFSGVAVGDWWVLKPNNADKSFIYRLIQTQRFDDIANQSAGSKMPRADWNLVSNTEFAVPVSQEEQEKIGEYFSSLDHLITLHQRKCEQTKNLKKYMLQKMFPQNGAKVPEIRFNGFTHDWEQRKLGDVFEQTSNLVNPKEDEIELWSLTVEDGLTKKSDRYNREFLVKKDDNFKEVRPGDIVYNPMNMTLGAVGYNGMAKSVAVSGYYTTMVAKENYDTYYINTWLKSPQAIRLYRTYATGSLIEKQRVQFPTLSIIPVTFPKYEEQTKIGSYFHSLDHLITLHQRQCDELKKMKKYMLQNMFI